MSGLLAVAVERLEILINRHIPDGVKTRWPKQFTDDVAANKFVEQLDGTFGGLGRMPPDLRPLIEIGHAVADLVDSLPAGLDSDTAQVFARFLAEPWLERAHVDDYPIFTDDDNEPLLWGVYVYLRRPAPGLLSELRRLLRVRAAVSEQQGDGPDCITHDGVRHGGLDVDAVRVFRAIRDENGSRISGPELQRRLLLEPTRIDRLLKKLPDELQHLISSKPGAGYRWSGTTESENRP
jgi:hypothetical protein